MRILALQTEPLFAPLSEEFLRVSYIEADAVSDPMEAQTLASLYDYDAIVMNADFGGEGPLKILEKLKRPNRKLKSPILVFNQNALNPESPELIAQARTDALKAGADDVLESSATAKEITARLKALVRREHHHAHPVVMISPSVSFDLQTLELSIGGQNIELLDKTRQLLEQLVLHMGTRRLDDALCHTLYGAHYFSRPSVIPSDYIRDLYAAFNHAKGQYIRRYWNRIDRRTVEKGWVLLPLSA